MIPVESSVGSALSSFGDFFSGLISGTANMENAYFISFILYFILFMAIFMEGLRFVPIFGDKSSLNKQGKFFAVAAAALATLALFVVDQGTGVSMADRVEMLITPFGIWGGIVLAGIIALMTYKMVKDSDLFKEETITAMAIAAAVGATFAGFLLNLETVLGWGFLIMILVFIVGAVKAFSSHRKGTAEEREADREEKVSKGVRKYKDEEKEKKAEEKKGHLDRIRDFLVSCIDAADEVTNHLGNGDRKKAKESMNAFNKYIRIAWRELSKQATKAEEKERRKLEKLTATLRLIINNLREQVLEKLRADDWQAKVAEINANLKEYQAQCGAVEKALGKLA